MGIPRNISSTRAEQQSQGVVENMEPDYKVLFLLVLFFHLWNLHNEQHNSEGLDRRQMYTNTTTSPRLIERTALIKDLHFCLARKSWRCFPAEDRFATAPTEITLVSTFVLNKPSGWANHAFSKWSQQSGILPGSNSAFEYHRVDWKRLLLAARNVAVSLLWDWKWRKVKLWFKSGREHIDGYLKLFLPISAVLWHFCHNSLLSSSSTSFSRTNWNFTSRPTAD